MINKESEMHMCPLAMLKTVLHGVNSGHKKVVLFADGWVNYEYMDKE